MSLVPRDDLGFDFVDLSLHFVDRAAKIIGDVNNRSCKTPPSSDGLDPLRISAAPCEDTPPGSAGRLSFRHLAAPSGG